jgi:predicted GIY-YIG superfamily endonuclease
MGWSVYVLVSASAGTTYVGISSDPRRRLDQHNGLAPGGAKATRAGRPWTIGATFGPYPRRGEAQRVEHRVKRLRGLARLEYAGG